MAVTDCKCFFDAVKQQNPSLAEKRTLIDLVGIRESLQADGMKWVPTYEQLADGLIKLDKDLMWRLASYCLNPVVALQDTGTRVMPDKSGD